ncbi:hypothetical protein [Flavobacterium humidisoli]|uniref:Uncharacterized protein n=1 Tax=Flavobacterium humidisoli TaxID=2937442 RepID=A0ABY4LXR4_9FLAO|nr:hypothetical protein [Flavobacterium humidisoli]UPZ17617.1 hypothetical protein M0M44_09740 [Flavobacterium humidisoli]
MAKLKIRFIDIIYGIAIIVADLVVFIILGVLLMGYDDNYDSSEGEYWSFASMNMNEKIIYICYNVWIVLNIIGFIYIGRKIYIKTKINTT